MKSMWVLVFIVALLHYCLAHSIVPTTLRCENHAAPIGTTGKPSFAWKFNLVEGLSPTTSRNCSQTAYQLVVETDNGDSVWDSGQVQSRKHSHLMYQGKPLSSHKSYNWRVRIWDHTGSVSPWSATSRFTTSILNGNFSADWISSETGTNVTGNYLRKEFSVDSSKKVWRALVTIVGLGLYELRLSGEKVGDSEISNGFTHYNKTVLTATYDITSSIINNGTNTTFAFGVILGNGMYKVTQGYGRYTNVFKDNFGPRKLLLQLDVEYTDGSVDSIVSDSSWKSTQGPITFTSIYGGEDYNATLEEDGWDQPNFNNTDWSPVYVVLSPLGTLAPYTIRPVKIQKVYTTQKVTQQSPTSYLYDLGQNFAGWPQITVKGERGAVVKLTPAEILQNGYVDQSCSGSPVYYTYVLRGGQIETWHPRFSYYGFRYVSVSLTGSVSVVSLEGHFIHADLDVVGSFITSNALLNRIHEMIIISMLSNLQSIFHDCPHREKLGWLEQSHLLAKSVAYNFDVNQLFAKVVRDIYDSQVNGGLIPTTAPSIFYPIQDPFYTDSPEWGSTYVIIPYFLYEFYGNIEPLSQYYESIMGYLHYLSSRATNNIVSYGLGDWLDIIVYPTIKDGSFPKNTPVNYTATSYYYQDLVILNASAQALGLTADVAKLNQLAESVKQTINSKFFSEDLIQYSTGSQTANAMALYLGYNDPNYTQPLVDAIVKDVRSQQNHTTSGDIGHVYFLRALASNGRSDVIYDVHTTTDRAGYGYMLSQGATSLAETWDYQSSASHNHAMLGHIEEWFYEYLGGIQFSHDQITIQPSLVPDLTYVNSIYDSISGLIESSWTMDRTTNTFRHAVQIPINAHATIKIQANESAQIYESGVEIEVLANTGVLQISRRNEYVCEIEVGSGTYSFTVVMK